MIRLVVDSWLIRLSVVQTWRLSYLDNSKNRYWNVPPLSNRCGCRQVRRSPWSRFDRSSILVSNRGLGGSEGI